ncbi:MAG: DUF4007 family protein [Candidatus Muiribacteriota bacterium]
MFSGLDKYSKGSAGRHETFVPRFGWLTKGYMKCLEISDVFTREDAVVQLGVGKNMVRSIRFWCLSFGLLKKSENGKGKLGPTDLGEKLIGYVSSDKEPQSWLNGWDPYIEDDATLWLLHWNLFLNSNNLVSLPIFFNYCNFNSFTRKELSKAIIQIASGDEKLNKISPNSFEKDANCIVQMYTNFLNSENDIKCPFNSLNILEKSKESSAFRFSRKSKTIPPLIFLAACFSYAASLFVKEETFSFNQIVYGQDSPGVAFKLTETECGKLLERATKDITEVRFIEYSGIQQLYFTSDPESLYWKVLKKYYDR